MSAGAIVIASRLELHVLEVTRFVVDADAWRCDPGGVAARRMHWAHQTLYEPVVIGRRQHRLLARFPLLARQRVAVGIGMDRGELADPPVERNMRQTQAVWQSR